MLSVPVQLIAWKDLAQNDLLCVEREVKQLLTHSLMCLASFQFPSTHHILLVGWHCLWRTRMWTNAQGDGHPAEYRWRPLCSAAKFGWRPLLECCALTLPRCETRWNLQGCPKLASRSQPLVGRSSPYYQDTWRRYSCLTFFSDRRYMP